MNLGTEQPSSKTVLKMMLILGLASSILPAFAQLGEVEGVVIDAATEEKIAGARISLCEDSGGKAIPRCLMTVTDDAARFVFTKCRPGRYYLRIEAAGYLSDFLILDGRGTAEFDLHSGDRRYTTVRLWPEASIKGRVLDELGRPMSGIDMVAILEIFEGGSRYLSRTPDALGVSTNEKGEFQIKQLKPGRYFLEAFSGPLSKLTESNVDKGYLPVYYPNASSVTTAAALCVDAGSENVVQFRLSPRRTYHVRGKLDIPSGLKRDFEPLIGLRDENGDLVSRFTFEYDRNSERFVLGRLSPGSYEVELRSGIYDSDLVARRKFTIIDSDIDGLLVQMQRPLQLRAFVRLPTGFSPTTPFSVRVRLERDGVPLRDESGWPITHAGELTLPPHLAPGHYGLHLFSEDSIYLSAAGIGAQDVLANGLLLDSDTTGMLDLRIAKANSTIAGRVVRESEVPGTVADVKLVEQGGSSPFVAKSVNADGTGRFLIQGVAPGRYNLVALDRVVRDAEFGPREWDQVKRWAKSINVGETTRITVELELARLAYVRTPCAKPVLP